ncbi:MAG TPA: hypothetical protein VGF01_05630 [Terracidiphilus sp.]|jgi:hypothetical protein
MPQQPEQTTLHFAPTQASEPGSASRIASGLPLPRKAAGHTTQRIPHWLARAELYLRVLLRAYFGLVIFYLPWSGQMLTYLPWSHILWDQNPLFYYFPTLGHLATFGSVRGVVSGLGALNLWFAFQDVIRHWDD